MKFIDVGFGNLVAVGRVVTVASPETAPIKRLCQDAREEGRIIDVSCGQKTRAMIQTDCGLVLFSALTPDEIGARLAACED